MALESDARVKIDEKLKQAGWIIQNLDQLNVSAGQGIAVREFPLSMGRADYLLVVDGEAVGVVEAKKAGTTLSGIKEQSALYQGAQPLRPTPIRFLRTPLPFSYETTDVETYFTNDLETEALSRKVFHFHQPATMAKWLEKAPVRVFNEQNDLLRSLLRRMPSLPRADLRPCQYDAITNLERSFTENRSRALIQMATGSGKTYMAVSSIYRLIKHARARRVLFLVDRTNLARQTYNQFQQFLTPDSARKFTELYNVQRLQDNHIDGTPEVCITTIQRLYSILTSQPLDQEAEEVSLFEKENDEEQEKQTRLVSYNPALPVEYFDVIFIDECHRSIYSEWRPALEYFDAFLVGLTATPENRAFAFFKRNLVYEYSQAQSVADSVNVDYDVYRLKTKITEQGSKVERGNVLPYRNKQTRERIYETLGDDLIYEGRHLDRDVMTPDQIRTVIRAYKDVLFTELFPGRSEVPKTLIFAKNDYHAEDIVGIVREEFGKGNDFAQKITYRSGGKPEELINQFSHRYNPRIAVSVDMISTGTDVKPLEVLLFMRPIKSRTLYEQMRGRGCRTIQDDEFNLITPSSGSKTRYILFDAIGVTEGLKSDNPPLERRPSVSTEDLMKQVANGNYGDATMLTLAGRLGRLVKYVTPDDYETLEKLTNGTLQELAEGLLTSLDYDAQLARAQQISGQEDPAASILEEAALQLAQEATQAFKSQELRDLILQLQRRENQAIDDISLDIVTNQGFNEEQARQDIVSFRARMEENKEKIDLFDLALSRPIGTSLTESIQSVARAIEIPTIGLNRNGIDRTWRAYQKLEAARVRGAGTRRLMTDIIALIRYTMQRETDESVILEPFQNTVNRRFAQWIAEQERLRQQAFSAEQHWWLDRIRDRIATDLQCEERDLDGGSGFDKGGRLGAANAFGSEQELKAILRELNERLVA
jgi:type I restriction enzyme R subunit